MFHSGFFSPNYATDVTQWEWFSTEPCKSTWESMSYSIAALSESSPRHRHLATETRPTHNNNHESEKPLSVQNSSDTGRVHSETELSSSQEAELKSYSPASG